MHADRFDAEVLHPFVLETCLAAAERGRRTRPADWAELADDVGEDEADIRDIVSAAGWEGPLRIDAEHLVLAALGATPLIEVEAEGLPLSLVRAAEAATRGGRPTAARSHGDDDALTGALFLADAALRDARLILPVPEPQAGRLLEALLREGLEAEEVRAVLPPCR